MRLNCIRCGLYNALFTCFYPSSQKPGLKLQIKNMIHASYMIYTFFSTNVGLVFLFYKGKTKIFLEHSGLHIDGVYWNQNNPSTNKQTKDCTTKKCLATHRTQYVVPGSSHSLFLASPSRGGYAQLDNAGVLCSWMF